MLNNISLNFPYAYGTPSATADFRVEPEDFQVDEVLGFEPAAEGEHVYLQVWKRGENTAWVAEKIAELAQVLVMDVGYCGRKDRHAVTTQWFSVYLPKKDSAPDWSLLNSDSIKVLTQSRHSHKLRRGDHINNNFVIRLRNVVFDNRTAFEETLVKLRAGVPNYYGEQRFGHNGNNLQEAERLLVEGRRIRDKQRRGLYLSAARSYLFNLVLAARVASANWQILLNGETEAYPTAPLWGRGRPLVTSDVLAFEQQVLEPWAQWCNGLEHAGLSQERRSLVLVPSDFSWRWVEQDVVLAFSLGSGEFATTILRELAVVTATIKTDSQ